MKNLILGVIIGFLFSSCKKSERTDPCSSYEILINKTHLQIAEYLYDTAFHVPDTVQAGVPVNFSFTYPYNAYLNSFKWNIDNGGYTSQSSSFNLRFNTGSYQVQLIANYISRESCDKRTSFTDTITKTLTIIPIDHTSLLEGSYTGFLDTRPNEIFTITIKYWKYPGDATGEYYLRNYVNGCTGDYINTHIPPGTGYGILSGYKSFEITSYPCNEPGDFKGFGFLNDKGDSITIKHFGYNTAQYIPGDTIPRWHVFKGKKI